MNETSKRLFTEFYQLLDDVNHTPGIEERLCEFFTKQLERAEMHPEYEAAATTFEVLLREFADRAETVGHLNRNWPNDATAVELLDQLLTNYRSWLRAAELMEPEGRA